MHPSRLDFFVQVSPLSIIFKAKFRDEMKKAGFLDKIPPGVWDFHWNVNIQAVGSSENRVAYLAPYVFRVAISSSRVVKVEDHKVTFKYKKGRSHRWRTETVDALEFIRRFLQHVLPTGFMKVRYYGFLHPSCSVSLNEIATKIEVAHGFERDLPKPKIEQLREPICQSCGGKLRFLYSILPFQMAWYRKGVGQHAIIDEELNRASVTIHSLPGFGSGIMHADAHRWN